MKKITKNPIFYSKKIVSQDMYNTYVKKKKTFIKQCRIMIFLVFIILWQVASDLRWIDIFYFSSPKDICILTFQSLLDFSLLKHITITLVESTVSFFLIIFIAFIFATLFWFNSSLGKIFEPMLIVLNSLPKSALAPLIIVWLGTGLKTIILCGMSVGVFGCILNLYQAFEQTDKEKIKLIKTFGGTKCQIFTKVVFPSNIVSFISLSKVNIGLALVGVIIGEFLAGRKGLGYLIIYGSQVFKLDMVIMSISILCLIAMLLYWIINLIEVKVKELVN